MNILEILKKLELFKDLTEAELDKVSRAAHPVAFEENQEIFHEKSQESHLYILTKGKVQILGALDKTEFATVHMILPGKLFGEFAFIDGQPRSATAVSIEQSEVLKVDREELYQLFEKDNRLGYIVMRNLSRILARRIRQTAHELRVSLMWEKA